MDVTFHDDAAAFLADAADLLATDPLSYGVIATVAERRARIGRLAGGAPCWFAVVRDDDQAVGVAMRTHPEPPHAGFVPAMPRPAVQALADALVARDERVPAWNGDADAALTLCTLAGAPHVRVRTRLFEARTVTRPARPDGRLRPATLDDLPLVLDWKRAFHHDSETQGGREPGPGWTPDEATSRAEIERGAIHLWEVDGRVTHLTAVQAPMFGVERIGPVYTPAADRGHGYAGWVVAELTQAILDRGHRPCLYTDQANPVSNAIYERIGYIAVHDSVEVVAEPHT